MMLSVCPSSVLCYLISSQKQWHHSNKWQLKVFWVSFVSCFCVFLIPLNLYFPHHFKFSHCGFMVQGIFQEYNPTQRVNTTNTSKTQNFSVWKHTLVSRIPDSHKVLYFCRLFAFTENPLNFLSSSNPANLRSHTTKFQKPPSFRHAQSIYWKVQSPD
jgi:hypothetical protein